MNCGQKPVIPGVYCPEKRSTWSPKTLMLSQVAPIISSTPLTKVGVEISTYEVYVISWSESLYWRTAPQTPRLTPTRAAKIAPTISSRRLIPALSAIWEVTSAPEKSLFSEPRVTIRTSQSQVRTRTGTLGLTPISFRIPSMASCGIGGFLPWYRREGSMKELQAMYAKIVAIDVRMK